MSKVEFVEVSLKVPKKIVKFLEMFQGFTGKSPKEYLEKGAVEFFCSDLSSGVFADPQALIKTFDLQEFFKDC